MLRDVHLARLGDLLHARREAHDVPLRGVVHAQVVADRADHHLARVETHPDREVESTAEAQFVGVAAQRLLEVERRVAGALRVVLMGDGRAEERHDTVAGELGDRPLEAMHALGEERSEALHDLVEDLGIDLLG